MVSVYSKYTHPILIVYLFYTYCIRIVYSSAWNGIIQTDETTKIISFAFLQRSPDVINVTFP